jgi:tetratricopeptide (TPR) repeat protein
MTSPQWCLLALSLNVALASLAGAQTSADERAQFHFRAGTSYFEDGRFAESAEQFDEAYRLSQRPMLLANASLAYERAGNLAVAIERLEAFFAADAGDVGGGYMTSQERLEGLRARHALQLQQAAEHAATTEQPSASDTSVESSPDNADDTRRPLRLAGLATGAGGIALGATALALGLRARAVHRDLTRACGPTGDACPPSRADDIERGPRLSRSAGALGIAAGASMAVGLTLYLLGRAPDEDQPTARVVLDVAPAHAQLTVVGSF